MTDKTEALPEKLRRLAESATLKKTNKRNAWCIAKFRLN